MGGETELRGPDAALCQLAKNALQVSTGEDATRRHVHGFHSYPARLHPDTAARLVEGLSDPAGGVIDPFCGSGTVLVEARLQGRHCYGVDLNPIAVRLARLKTWGGSPDFDDKVREATERVSEHATERRMAKAGPTMRYATQDRAEFDIHVLLELDGLRAGIDREKDRPVQEVLFLIFSSILTKVSKSRGDAAEGQAVKRHAAGFPTRLFGMRTDELLKVLTQYRDLLPDGAPNAKITERDARRPFPWKNAECDAAITSPPYPGVYDYLEHHTARLRWLRLDQRRFETQEVGARRHLGRMEGRAARHAWEEDLTRVLRQVHGAVRSGGHVALVMADSAVHQTPLFADEIVEAQAERAKMAVAAVASQQRPHFHQDSRKAFRDRPRREHLIILKRL